jgi:dUTP pyrophosphatase
MQIQFKKIREDVPTPQYQTSGSAAFDFHIIEDVEIPARGIEKIPTGLVIKAPDNHALIIASRSSSPIKKGVTVAQGIGIVDSDYSGPEDEIFILLQNVRDEIITLKKGDRVAQGMFMQVTQGAFHEVKEMTDGNRGGHGSTGT